MKRRRFLERVVCGTAFAGLGPGGRVSAGEARPRKETAAVANDIGKLDRAMAAKKVEDGVNWHDVRDWGVEGKGWADTARYFDRLPARADGVVRPPVWSLSRHSAGMCVRFETDAGSISARWTLLSNSRAMTHMPATGVSGLDLYGRAPDGTWRWVGVGRPESAPNASATLVSGLPRKRLACALYLPLYNGVESLEVGIPSGASLWPVAPRQEKQIVFYGTSIMQGGCASRPGMAHASILGRRLDRAIINLGFSGNGTMDLEVGQFMAELNPCVYVIDCLPNMQAGAVAERTVPLVRVLRDSHSSVPIVLVEDRTYTNAFFVPGLRVRHDASRAALRACYEQLKAAGVPGLHYVEGEDLLGDDGEATVDGSHATDLGFVRMADVLEPVLRPLV